MANPGRKPRLVLDAKPGTEYDENTFLYFFDVERARAERSNRQLRLLLATLEPVAYKPVAIPPKTAATLFDGLRVSLRETDVTGWYRQHRVAAALLAHREEAPGSDVSLVIRDRVRENLLKRLPDRFARCLRVRVIPVKKPFVV